MSAPFESRCRRRVTPQVAVVLHYESASYSRWRVKFTELATRHGNDALINSRLNSQFYEASIQAGRARSRAPSITIRFSSSSSSARTTHIRSGPLLLAQHITHLRHYLPASPPHQPHGPSRGRPHHTQVSRCSRRSASAPRLPPTQQKGRRRAFGANGSWPPAAASHQRRPPGVTVSCLKVSR